MGGRLLVVIHLDYFLSWFKTLYVHWGKMQKREIRLAKISNFLLLSMHSGAYMQSDIQ